jgi:hypothetical protein
MKITFTCLNCSTLCDGDTYHSKCIYCSNKCQQEYQHNQRIKNWFDGAKTSDKTIKRYLIEKKNACWCCDITEWNSKTITLELEHIDGNSDNNVESNLSLLCPNCHSQTSTYKAKNKGNGRHYRRINKNLPL